MKIAVLSDIHGNGTALQYVVNDLKDLEIKKIIVLGDIVMKGPMPAQSIDMLRSDDFEVIAWVKGNTDLWLEEITDDFKPSDKNEEELYSYYQYAKANLKAEEVNFLEQLPLKASVNLNGINILCVHGTPKSIVEAIDDSVPEEEIRNAVKDVKEDLILSGHSHTSFACEIDGKVIFNVGSIGNSLDGDRRISYGILDFTEDKVDLIRRRVRYPIDEVIAVAIAEEFPLLNKYENMILNASM